MEYCGKDASVDWTKLKTGAKYAVFDEAGNPVMDDAEPVKQIVGWFSAQSAIRDRNMGMIFRTDQRDVLHWTVPPPDSDSETKGGRVIKPDNGRPIQLLGFGYGLRPNLTPTVPIENYKVIPTYVAFTDDALEGFKYRYCLLEEAPEAYRKLDEKAAPVGAKRKKRKTMRRRSRRRKATRRR